MEELNGVRRREDMCLKVRGELITRKREWVKWKRIARGNGCDR